MWNISAVQFAESSPLHSSTQVSLFRKKGEKIYRCVFFMCSVFIVLFSLHTVILKLKLKANRGHPHLAIL